MIRWLYGLITEAKEMHIAHLEAENTWLRAQMLHERQRAEISIDQRLAERGLGPVTLPPRRTESDPVAAVIESLSQQPQFFASSLGDDRPTP